MGALLHQCATGNPLTHLHFGAQHSIDVTVHTRIPGG